MTYYQTALPHNVCSHNTKTSLPGCKSICIPDKDDHCHITRLCHNQDPFSKHHCTPYHYGYNSHCRHGYDSCYGNNHCYDPCYGNNHGYGHGTASWYHAHDSGNTVVLNVPCCGWGTRTGIGTDPKLASEQNDFF
ncbi:hypothetical protein [Wolbachia endosymbiont (group B) of Germaria angustata]|uniref:hypothetical protein n=1 Tax=Wolbachia endosymbiont (group B) of Germaria angustata TaxID=3077916 RepID=UPI0031334118